MVSPACPKWLPDPITCSREPCGHTMRGPGADLLLPFFLGPTFQPVCPYPLSPNPSGATLFPLPECGCSPWGGAGGAGTAAAPGQSPSYGVCSVPSTADPSPLQLVPRGHQPDRRRDTAEAVQGGQLPGAQQRDQQE